MLNGEQFSLSNLTELFERSPQRDLRQRDKIVIFSDLHMGNGGRNDVFTTNAPLFTTVVESYYATGDYELIVNGDLEDLQRFPRPKIEQRWSAVYGLLRTLLRADRFTRIVGNHDIDVMQREDEDLPAIESLRLRWKNEEIFIFHGHQTSRRYERHNHWIHFMLRYLANPLHIRNISVSHSSSRRFHTERRAYQFATQRRVAAVIGHTHRPLFESMSKLDRIQFDIERLCRKYPKARHPHKIERRITKLKRELSHLTTIDTRGRDHTVHRSTSLYQDHLLVPSLFNSGCVLGKRGMTALEISQGEMRLVYWFDQQRRKSRRLYLTHAQEHLAGTPYVRVVIQSDTLDYIFSRIRLLA